MAFSVMSTIAMDKDNDFFVTMLMMLRLSLSLWQRLSAIKVELELDLSVGELMQICIHRKDNSPKPVNHRLTLKEGPKVKSNIRRCLAQDFI